MKRAAVLLLALAVVIPPLVAVASSTAARGTSRAETRADLDAIVVRHVRNLLENRFQPAWARIHPLDRQVIGREPWEMCKRAPDPALRDVQYVGVRVIRARAMRLTSSLHARIPAVAVTVEVRALVGGQLMRVSDVSHWTLHRGHWFRLVEPWKLAAYAEAQCP